MSIQKNRELMIEQIKRLRTQLKEDYDLDNHPKKKWIKQK